MSALAWPLVFLVSALLAYRLGLRALGARPELHARLDGLRQEHGSSISALTKERQDDRERLAKLEAEVADIKMQLRE